MTKWLGTMALSAVLMSQPSWAQDSEHSRLKDQLEIFTGILETAAEQGGEQGAGLTDFDYTYLRDQGVVFRTRLGRSSWRFVTPDIPEPPMPPEPEEMNEFARDMQLDVVIEQGLRTAHRVLSKLSGEYSEEWFELSEQQRDLAWDIRDREREVRDLEFQLRNAENKEQVELKQELEQQRTELEALRQQREEVRAEANKLKRELEAKQEAIREQQLETRDKAIARVEKLLSNTLCDYGITLKALDDDEFISFVIEGADNSAGDRRRDRVYVFSQEQVKGCQSADDAAKLLEAANPYYF